MKNLLPLKIYIILCIFLFSYNHIQAQAIDLIKAEYFIDTDPGFDLANDISIIADSVINQTANIDLNNITIGFHHLFIRTKDANGKWSLCNRSSFFKTSLDANISPSIVKAEYFIDTDPGYGYASDIPVTIGATLSNINLTVNVDNLSEGFHTLSLRSKDINGIWSICVTKSFYKLSNLFSPNITKVEYFIDNDPGFSLGNSIPSANGSIINNTIFSLDLNGVSEGFHQLNIRSLDANGIWSLTNTKTFYKSANNMLTNIVKAEYFVDSDPGFGNAISIPLMANNIVDSVHISPNYCSLSLGNHQLFVRCLDANGKWSITNSKTVNVQMGYFYADTDHDTYGNPNDSLLACAAPNGYVANKADCNDYDSLEHPNQLWFIDQDADHYGTGYSILQCSRPLAGYTINELISVDGDCDDNNASINPGAQHFTYSGTPDFIASLISPNIGSSYTNFNVEVVYFDSNNNLPPATFPRVIFDYEGNNVFNDPNDRVIILSPSDINDVNVIDGKKYIATISSLPIGTSYKTSVQCIENGCETIIGPFNYPIVLQQPDLELFANDITFSNPHPSISSPLIINAKVHNVSDYAAQNFVVHLRNQYDTSIVYPDQLITFIPPHGTYEVSWNITTPTSPAWCPMEVSVDYNNDIIETNELDNSAIRPFVNGNFNLPGGIQTLAYVNPSIGYTGAITSLSGMAHYYGTAVPLIDSSTAGASVNFTIVETGATYSTNTNSNGSFSALFNNPLAPGVYHIQGTISDFTLSGNFTAQFEVIEAPVCNLPDLKVLMNASSSNSLPGLGQNLKIIEGDSIQCISTVTNIGYTNAVSSILTISNYGSTTSIAPIMVPALAIGSSSISSFTVKYPTPGFYNLTATVDANNVIMECEEVNTNGINVQVLSALADIIPFGGPTGIKNNCSSSNLNFSLVNLGGASSGLFYCQVIRKRNDTLLGIDTIMIPNIPSALFTNNSFDFSLPFTPTVEGYYTFELKCDSPFNNVIEFNETNNTALYIVQVIACKPNLSLIGCDHFNAESVNGDYTSGTNITIKSNLYNNGNLAYNGPLAIRYQLSGGSIMNDTVNANLIPGASMQLTKIISAPSSIGESLSIIADPDDLIDEFNETDNAISDKMCWDFYIDSSKGCTQTSAFWEKTWLVNQALYATVGIGSLNLYKADTLLIKFEVSGPGLTGKVNLGNAVLYDVEKTCFCPVIAYLPTSFVFSQVGTYIFTMTVDPDNKYNECYEGNNVLVRSLNVANSPDMRELSQYIAPSSLNPQIGQAVSFNISYDNIGANNLNDQMKLKVLVDNIPIATINNVNGLLNGDNATVNLSNSWSSNITGIHVIRAIIDADNNINELNELNNEATRTIIVGPSANLYFQAFTSLTLYPNTGNLIQIKARIGNSGDLVCHGDLQLYYVDNFLDTILFYTQAVHVNGHDSISYSIPWNVLDNKTTIIGRIINTSALEYSYEDNIAHFELGKMNYILNTLPACDLNNMGQISITIVGGEAPYSYAWSNGYNGPVLHAVAGTYSVVVTDNTGQTVSANASISTCPPVTLDLQLFIQGYYDGSGYMKPVLMNQGELFLPTEVDSIIVELHDTISPYNIIETYNGILKTNGHILCYFTNNVNTKKYYIAVKHRNLVSTWSKYPFLLSTNCSYSFSSSKSQSFGDNLLEIEPGIWAMYSGDLNADENIDLLDGSVLEADINNFVFGYHATDINGDGNVDLLDSPQIDENANAFIFSMHP